MSKKAYYGTIPLNPTQVLELLPFNDGTNRGAKIINVRSNNSKDDWVQALHFPSKIISIAGERITNYTFKNIKRMLNTCNTPIKLRLESMGFFTPPSTNTNVQSSDSESDFDISSNYNKKSSKRLSSNSKSPYNNRYNKQRHSNKYDPKKNNTNNKRKRSDSTSSTKSNNISSIEKPCSVCSKSLRKLSKQHRCRRCGSVVCSLHSKNKRKEVGYFKLVRVCDSCIERDEFGPINVEPKPFGIVTKPLHGNSNDIGGILINNCVAHGPFKKKENETIKFKQTIIININDYNIELLPYNEAIEILRDQTKPFIISCKRWNKFTKHSAKESIEKEHQERITMELKKMQQIDENENENDNKLKNDDDHKQTQDDTNNTTNKIKKHFRNGTDTSISSDGNNNILSPQSLLKNSGDQSPSINNPSDLYSTNKTSTERYAGPDDIEDHSAMDLIRSAEESEKNNDLEVASNYYDLAIKQFETAVHQLDNNKIKRKWKEKLNDYYLALNRIKKKLKQRKRSDRMKPKKGSRAHKRAETLAVTKKTRKKSSENIDYTSNMKNPEDKDNKDDKDSNNQSEKPKKKKNDQDEAFRSRLMADIITDKPNVSFKDVQGLVSVKLAIYEAVILPQKRPELFTGLRKPAMGLLLFGPPGNGKTMIAKCIATEIDCTFFSISASSITSKFVGDAERIMRTLFNMARDKAPSIIFIDEIDSLLTARGGSNEAESSRRIKTEFLVQFDGVQSKKELDASVLIIGATNLPDQLDEAVLRRFAKRILVPHPEYDTRYGLIRNLTKNEDHALSENDFVKIAKSTDRYSCSDLSNLCTDAALGPVREMGSLLVEENFSPEDMPKLNMNHFENSLKNIRSSLAVSSLKAYSKWDQKFGSKSHLTADKLPEFLKATPINPINDSIKEVD